MLLWMQYQSVLCCVHKIHIMDRPNHVRSMRYGISMFFILVNRRWIAVIIWLDEDHVSSPHVWWWWQRYMCASRPCVCVTNTLATTEKSYCLTTIRGISHKYIVNLSQSRLSKRQTNEYEIETSTGDFCSFRRFDLTFRLKTKQEATIWLCFWHTQRNWTFA